MYKTVFISFVVVIGMVACDAQARSRNVASKGRYSFQIETHGRQLPTYNHRGHTYVEGRLGEYYGIRVFNHTGERVEAMVTVDGRDVISGRSRDYRNQRGYVIEPYGSVLLDGFRRSMEKVAAFRFTDVGDSYASRMGDARNVGVIGVAVFKERRRRPQPRPPIAYDTRERLGTGYGASRSKKSAPSARGMAPRETHDYSLGESESSYRSQGLGTQYGKDTYSPAVNTHFTRRRHSRPDVTLALRYDDYEGLVARGVLPRPRPQPIYRPQRQPRPDPFPEATVFAPAPPTYYWD